MIGGVAALVMLIIELGIRSPVLALGWIVTDIFVAWRCFVSVPHAVRQLRYHEARYKLLAPAILNILFLGVLPGVILLVAFFRSAGIENAPPLRFDREG